MTSTLLSVLVVDQPGEARERLMEELKRVAIVTNTKEAEDLQALATLDREADFNTVFIDPLAFDLNEVSKHIFNVRVRSPSIVFALYVNFDDIERRRSDFFAGERRRFLHYYRLNKGELGANFGANLELTLDLCRYDLDWQMSKESIELLRTRIQETGDRISQEALGPVLQAIVANLSQLRRRESTAWSKTHDRTVFLSYAFSEGEYVEALKDLLESRGFTVVTGENTNTYISKAIHHRIETASLFLCLLTRRHALNDGFFLPSLWLVEEKAIAIASNKPMVLMVEDGVLEIGGLQSDYQRIHFSEKGFMTAALKAVRQLESYLGGSDSAE
jgi:hypothetical protein